LQLSLGAEDGGGITEDKLLYEAGGDECDSHIEDFLLYHGSNGSSGLSVEIVFGDEVFHYSGLVPAGSTAGLGGFGQDLDIGVVLNVNGQDFDARASELAAEVMVSEAGGGVLVTGGGQDGLDYGEDFAAGGDEGFLFVIKEVCYDFGELLGTTGVGMVDAGEGVAYSANDFCVQVSLDTAVCFHHSELHLYTLRLISLSR
jgi:hypothetical protein